MTVKYHEEVEQGSEEWGALRRGILTASEMKLIVTPTLKTASNDKEKQHLYELLAQQITGYVEPAYISDDMLRGREDEIAAIILYDKNYGKVKKVGFITNDKFGYTIGYSPDGVVGDDGLVECKSRRQKYQIQTLLSGEVPEEYSIQLQTGLLVSERKWIDFVSYSGGLPMFVKRVYPDEKAQLAIEAAATVFNDKLKIGLSGYENATEGLIKTERRLEEELVI